jgi:hypothetical protein
MPILTSLSFLVFYMQAGMSSAYSFHVHSVCGIFAMLDLTLSRFPLYLKRCYPSALLLLAYLSFTGAMWQQRHTGDEPTLS